MRGGNRAEFPRCFPENIDLNFLGFRNPVFSIDTIWNPILRGCLFLFFRSTLVVKRVSGFRPQAHLFLFCNTVPVMSAYSRILARFVQDYFCCICPNETYCTTHNRDRGVFEFGMGIDMTECVWVACFFRAGLCPIPGHPPAGHRERVLFIGTQFSILYTVMYSPA